MLSIQFCARAIADLGEFFFPYGVPDNTNTARLRLKDSLQHYRDRIHSESGVCNENESFENPQERMRQWNRRNEAKPSTGETVRRTADFRPSSIPVANHSNQSEHDSISRQKASVRFATHGTLGLLDSGASETVMGSNQLPDPQF